MPPKDADVMAISVIPDQKAPMSSMIWFCTVWSGLSVENNRIIMLYSFYIERYASQDSGENFFMKSNKGTSQASHQGYLISTFAVCFLCCNKSQVSMSKISIHIQKKKATCNLCCRAVRFLLDLVKNLKSS